MKRNARDNEESARRISRRALVVGAAQIGVVSALGLRMKAMQVEQADHFRLLAEEKATYSETFSGFSLTKFDGTQITI